MRAAAEQNLVLGWTVVVDAVNDSEAARDTWRTAAAATSAELAFVLLVLDDQIEHRRRLQGRVRGLTHIAEPSWEHVQERAADYAPWAGPCLRVSAADPAESVVRAVLDQLRGA